MVIAPIIFLTVVIGIGSCGDLKKVGRIGGKALLYFEIVTTFALVIGIIVVNFTSNTGAGFLISMVQAELMLLNIRSKQLKRSMALWSLSWELFQSSVF